MFIAKDYPLRMVEKFHHELWGLFTASSDNSTIFQIFFFFFNITFDQPSWQNEAEVDTEDIFIVF